MKSPIIKIAAAAIITIAAALILRNGSIDITSVTWANMQEAFLAKSWVHLQYDNNYESWHNLITGDYCSKKLFPRGESFFFLKQTDDLRQEYTPGPGQHIRELKFGAYKDNIIPPYEPKTAWETIVGHWEKIAEQGGSASHEVEINVDTLDGKTVVRFDVYYIDALDRKLLREQLWADPITKLPIKIRQRLTISERENQGREYITGVFSFPENGPLSIYDLGVPQDTPIVKNYDRIADPSVVQVIEAGYNALCRFPLQYRLIMWENHTESEIDIYWRNGTELRHERYFNISEEPEYQLELPVNATEVLEWTRSQIPVCIDISGGEKDYYRRGPLPRVFKDQGEPTVRVTRPEAYFISSEPHGDMWPYATRDAIRSDFYRIMAEYEQIIDVPEELSEYIGLRREFGNVRRDFYIDPEHDYIYVRCIWWKLRSGNWEKEREYEHSNFKLLRDGQWYPTKRVLITYPDPERGTVGGGANWNIDIAILEEHEFSPGTFNGEKLLEGAKIETY